MENNEDANVAAVKAIFADADANGWAKALSGMLADDVEGHVLQTEIGVQEGTIVGKEAILAWFGELDTAFADLPKPDVSGPQEFYADGDTVIVLCLQAGTIIKTGERYVVHQAYFFTFGGGKIQKIRLFF